MNAYIGNRGGIPVIQTTPVVGTADVRYPLPNNVFRFLGAKGKIVITLTNPLPTDVTTTLPVLVEVNGETKPLNNTTGAALTAGDVVTTIVMDVLFDKSANTLTVTSSLI